MQRTSTKNKLDLVDSSSKQTTKPILVPIPGTNRTNNLPSGSPMSFSMMVDHNSAHNSNNQKSPVDKIEPFSHIEPRKIYSWVNDEATGNCHECQVQFNLFTRRHHCRLCGRIFCDKCSHHRMKVPFCLRPRIPAYQSQPGFINSTLNLINPLNYYGKDDKDKKPTSNPSSRPVSSGSIGSGQISRSNTNNKLQEIAQSPKSDDFIEKYFDSANTTGHAKSRYKNMSGPVAPGTYGTYGTFETAPTSGNSSSSGPDNANIPRNSSNDSLYDKSIEDENQKVRVCGQCANKLGEINKLERMIIVFKRIDLDIMDWKSIGLVCKTWRQISNYYLSKYREIQYYLPGHIFNSEDRAFLWTNREYLIGHGLWMLQLLRSIDYESYEVREGRLAITLELISKYMGSNLGSETVTEDDSSGNNKSSHNTDKSSNVEDWLKIDSEYSKLGRSYNDDIFNVFSTRSNTNANGTKLNQSFAHFGCCKEINHKNKPDLIEMHQLLQTSNDKREVTGDKTKLSEKPAKSAKSAKSAKQEEIEKLVQKAIDNKGKRRASCWTLMCSRHCNPYLRPEDALTLLDRTVQSRPIRELAIRYLRLASNWELRCYLPLLVHYMRYEPIDGSIVGNFIISRCTETVDTEELDLEYMNDVYWQLKINLESKAFFLIYKYFLDKFCYDIPKEILEVIMKGQHLVNLLENIPNRKKNKLSASKPNVDEIKQYVASHINVETLPYLTIPTKSFVDYTELDIDKLHVKHSATEPIILPFKYISDTNTLSRYEILYKSEDIRKDQIIMKIIQLMDAILKQEEGLDLNIITYEVRPTSSGAGIIEIIPNCATMYHIKEKMKLSVLNYIIENNPSETVEKLRSRFLQSCAAYCVITYLLGIGDRHLDNIMVTTDGVMFHIDYGFVLGFDPKPMTSPKIRIDPDMIDALGGIHSQNYKRFKELCNQIYNCLRRHVNLFINLLTLLIEVDPPITNKVNFTRKILMEEIMKRFIPGESYGDAELQLTSHIENSNNTYGQYLNDWVHYHARENTLQSMVVGTFKNTKKLFSSFMK